MEHRADRDKDGPLLVLSASAEGGGFFGYFGSEQCVGRVALLKGLPGAAVEVIDRGDVDLFNHFVRSRRDTPSTYDLLFGATARIYDEFAQDWDNTEVTILTEFEPFHPAVD
jgi:hypothetical protein